MIIDEIVITGDNFECTEAMNSLVQKKFERLLKHYGHYIQSANILLKLDAKQREIAEINIVVKDEHMNASANTEDMYKSIDEVMDRIKTQLERYKEIHANHHKESLKHISL